MNSRFLLLSSVAAIGAAFTVVPHQHVNNGRLFAIKDVDEENECISNRRDVLAMGVLGGLSAISGLPAFADDEIVESIAAKAARMAKEVEDAEKSTAPKSLNVSKTSQDTKTIYDFTVPVEDKPVPFGDFINQEYATTSESTGEDGTITVDKKRARVKAILLVNIKQDDPIARKNIPEFISLASKFGKNGDFAVVCVPTDQGYYEPDTSALIRLKMDREYGYGINPATHLTDKMNLLGTGAHPLMRWVEGTCRTPAGLGRIEGNFEKFLIDGDSGKPIRRYPRKYNPYDITDDIKAVIDGKPLPPAGSNYLEQWREAAYDAERDTYRFQKGLNVFDQ